VTVVLYTRQGCHLCDVARDVILAQRARAPFDFREVDIDADDELIKEYGIRIPVVSVDGVERFEIAVEPAEFAALLEG
jgi:glutaredoxin